MKDPNENRKGYQKTKVGWIPNDWSCQHFADGFQKKISEVDVDPSVKYTEIGVRSHGRGIFKKEAILGRELGKKRVYWIKERCVLFNIVFAWEQAVAVTSGDEVGCIASHRFPMYEALEGWEPSFCSWYLRTARGKYALGIASPGGAGRNRTLGSSDLAVLCIPKPPLAEAKKIVAIVEEGDRTANKLGELIKAKKRQKKALMQQLLAGKKRLPGFSGPWLRCHLGDLFDERNQTKSGSLPLLAITGSKGIIPASEIDRKDSSSADKSKYKVIEPGDIGYNTMRMWQGVSAVSSLRGIVSPAYTICIPRPSVDVEFMGALFKFPPMVNKFWRFSQGVVDDTLNLKFPNFAAIPVEVPEKDEQTAIANVLKAAHEEIKLLERKHSGFERQRKALMQKLLIGEVRVKV